MHKICKNFLFGSLMLLCLAVVSIKAETFHAYLTGAQEVPAVSTNGSGYARIFLNESTGTISYTIVFRNLSSAQTASHIHAPAAIGANAGVIINFGAVGGTSGTITGTAAITATQIAQLRANQGYVNVHTANFAGGEIRGQIGKKRPVDFDGDGRTDYSILRFPDVAPPGEAPITFWNLTSTNGVEGTNFGNANTDFPAPGDYDGDGEDDFAIYRSGAAAGDQSGYYIIKSSNGAFQYYAWGVRGDQSVARDYDGDGITDPAVLRPGATATAPATWYIRQSATNTAFIYQFGLTGDGTTFRDYPIPGDYDGDGKFDIAIYRFGSSPANTYIYRQSSDGAIKYRTFGNFNTDYIVPGDYDGDGKFDFAVARVGSGTTPMVWWILRSSDGQTSTRTFGISSDIPTQGDYDGDSRTDIAIYRPGTAVSPQSYYWVFNSLSNTTVATPWGQQGDFSVNTFDAR